METEKRKTLAERIAEGEAIIAALRARLEAEHGTLEHLSEEAADAVWNLAWQEGHAYGDGEVSHHYAEIVEVALIAVLNCRRSALLEEVSTPPLTPLEEEMLAALRPFAKFADKAEQFVEDRVKDGGSPIMPSTDFRLADFHRAKEALTKAESLKAQAAQADTVEG